MSAPVPLLQAMDTWRCWNGRSTTAVPGTRARARLQPKGATWQCCSMPTRTAVNSVHQRAGLQPEVATWQCCSNAHQHGCEWGPGTCSAAAEGGNLTILRWLRQQGCPWDFHTSHRAAFYIHLELLRWARQQQPPCPLWSHQEFHGLLWLAIDPCVLVYLAQQQVRLPARLQTQACVSATAMTHAFLSLRAALPDRTPHELVLSIVSLAFSKGQDQS